MAQSNLKYSKAPTVIFRLPISSQLKRMLLFVLASMENTGTKPTQGLLAYSVGTAVPTVSKLMNELQDEGWIEIVNPKNRKLKETNLYTINWNKIEEYATEKDYFTPTVFNKDVEQDVVEETSIEEVMEVKTPFVQVDKEAVGRKSYEESVDGVLSELVEIAVNNKGMDLYFDRLEKHSIKLSEDFNKPIWDVKSMLNSTAKKMYLNAIEVKEVS